MTIVTTLLAPKFKVELEDFYVDIEGDLDSDGYTGKDPDVRIGLQDIRYTMHIKSSAPEKNIQRLCDTVAKYCPVKDTLRGVPVTGSYVLED